MSLIRSAIFGSSRFGLWEASKEILHLPLLGARAAIRKPAVPLENKLQSVPLGADTDFILPPTSLKSPSRTGPQSGHPARQQRSIRNYQRLSALTDQAKTIPRQVRCRAKSP
jgi:hypothetical protein